MRISCPGWVHLHRKAESSPAELALLLRLPDRQPHLQACPSLVPCLWGKQQSWPCPWPQKGRQLGQPKQLRQESPPVIARSGRCGSSMAALPARSARSIGLGHCPDPMMPRAALTQQLGSRQRLLAVWTARPALAAVLAAARRVGAAAAACWAASAWMPLSGCATSPAGAGCRPPPPHPSTTAPPLSTPSSPGPLTSRWAPLVAAAASCPAQQTGAPPRPAPQRAAGHDAQAAAAAMSMAAACGR